ncbi:HAD-IIB family hydrolase [Ferrimonas lipolytica]|uniref:HAD-IIB family hydrolase n=1 Tax=Ferrimonas lipolytica TaxID=2724191 RepID=A0A6H1UAK3_9GAMM|nr:HAD-IIB family hydrolase [Ferrimonas lipolytica]QIZ76081.1 HAD-IIB family hydrolase [Ferrimonas lipolytica]
MDTTVPPILVVTDLDGSLLDHHNYSFIAASSALLRLSELDIPVICNTSKTEAELMPLRQALHNTHPFVVENGSAVHWPLGYFPAISGHKRVFGVTRQQVMQCIDAVRSLFSPPLEGFSDWSALQLIAHTGLKEEEATQALKRNYSEPLLWQQGEQGLMQFKKLMEARDLQLLQGGRFVHVLGRCDKGQSLEWLRHAYQQKWGQTPIIIALGDGQNDVAMLEQADWPVVIRSPQNDAPQLSEAAQKRCIYTVEYGPIGWNNAILTILQRLGI